MSRSKVLLVDDDQSFLDAMRSGLSTIFDLTTTSSPEEAIRIVEDGPFDAIVIDVEMPLMNGFQLLPRLQTIRPRCRYFFLTCLVDDASYVESLAHGPDDFLNKPISATRLAAAITHRLGKSSAAAQIAYHGLELLPDEAFVKVGESVVGLTPKEQRILKTLMQSPEKKLPRELLIGKVWGDVAVSQHTLDTHLSNLRKKISGAGVTLHVDPERNVCLAGTQE